LTLSREEIEAKARQLVDAVDETKESVQSKAIIVAIAVGVIIAAAFIIGRRRGSRNKTVVEVYRV
jgi:uncharacterized protein with NRDE domain